MLRVLGLVFVTGCLGGVLDANSRPSVMPKLSELPTDPVKRDAVLDQSGDTTGPEQGKSLSRRERKVETTAAFAAAIIGQMFSKTQNVTLGTATTVDENHLFEKPAQPRAASDKADDRVDDHPGQLLPWIPLH